jgi:hypothetical protein
MLTPALLRELERKLRVDDDLNYSIKSDLGDSYRQPIGIITYNNDGKLCAIWLKQNEDLFVGCLVKPNTMLVMLVKLEDGTFEIICNTNFVDNMLSPKDKIHSSITLAMLAHEIGHLIIDTDELVCTFHQYDLQRGSKNMFREITRSLCKGDVFKGELDADNVALQYCSRIDLILTHLYMMINQRNFGVRWEHFNRIVYHMNNDSALDKDRLRIEFISLAEIEGNITTET